jgi:hypothetical protein
VSPKRAFSGNLLGRLTIAGFWENFPDRPSFHLLVKFFSPATEQPEHRPAKSGVIVVPQPGIVMLQDNEPRDADLA